MGKKKYQNLHRQRLIVVMASTHCSEGNWTRTESVRLQDPGFSQRVLDGDQEPLFRSHHFSFTSQLLFIYPCLPFASALSDLLSLLLLLLFSFIFLFLVFLFFFFFGAKCIKLTLAQHLSYAVFTWFISSSLPASGDRSFFVASSSALCSRSSPTEQSSLTTPVSENWHDTTFLCL